MAFGACSGGDDTALSRAAFTEKTNAECATLKTAGAELQAAVQTGATGQDLATYIGHSSAALRRLVDAVDALVPPEELQSDVDNLLSLIGDYADGLDELAGRVKPDQMFAELQSANVEMVTRLNKVSDRINSRITKLDLTGCVAV
jgi:hypothetical protein